jgi:hypothetical protein
MDAAVPRTKSQIEIMKMAMFLFLVIALALIAMKCTKSSSPPLLSYYTLELLEDTPLRVGAEVSLLVKVATGSRTRTFSYPDSEPVGTVGCGVRFTPLIGKAQLFSVTAPAGAKVECGVWLKQVDPQRAADPAYAASLARIRFALTRASDRRGFEEPDASSCHDLAGGENYWKLVPLELEPQS